MWSKTISATLVPRSGISKNNQLWHIQPEVNGKTPIVSMELSMQSFQKILGEITKSQITLK